MDVGVLGSLWMGGHGALQKGGRESRRLCAWEALQRGATGELHLGGHRALKMKGHGSQQNRGTGIPEGRREHGALEDVGSGVPVDEERGGSVEGGWGLCR